MLVLVVADVVFVLVIDIVVLGVIMLVLVVVALVLRCLWAGGIVCGCGEPFGGGGHRLGAGGIVCGWGVVAMVVWWLASSC